MLSLTDCTSFDALESCFSNALMEPEVDPAEGVDAPVEVSSETAGKTVGDLESQDLLNGLTGETRAFRYSDMGEV